MTIRNKNFDLHFTLDAKVRVPDYGLPKPHISWFLKASGILYSCLLSVTLVPSTLGLVELYCCEEPNSAVLSFVVFLSQPTQLCGIDLLSFPEITLLKHGP